MCKGREGEKGRNEALSGWHVWIAGALREMNCACTRPSSREMTL